MTSDAIPWLLVLLGLLMAALASATSAALAVVNRVRLRTAIEQGSLRDRAAQHLLEDTARTWLTCLTLNTLGLLAVGVGSGGLVARLFPFGTPGAPELMAAGPLPLVEALLGVLAAALCVLVLAQYLPTALAARNPSGAVLALALPMRAVDALLRPFVALLEALTHFTGISLPDHARGVRENELRALVNVDDDNEAMEEEEMEMIAGVMEMGDTKVREVMVPRIDIVAMPIETGVREALDMVILAGHSRIPVYRGTIDDVAGLLYAKDLLKVFRDPDWKADLKDILRPAHFVPDSKPIDELLTDLQASRVHLALVVDEYGGTAGLVTIEDLIEQIVGDIQDEYDTESPEVESISEHEGIFSGGMDIDDANRLLDIALPTEEVDTLAGLVLTQLGRVPEPGDCAIFDDAEIQVLDVSGRRIHRVRVVKLSEDGSPTDGSRATAEAGG